MADPAETSINRMTGDDFCTVYTGERKFISMLKKYAKEYPDEVSIKMMNNNSIEVTVPYNWFQFIRPKRSWKLTEEQRKTRKENLKIAREKKKEKAE